MVKLCRYQSAGATFTRVNVVAAVALAASACAPRSSGDSPVAGVAASSAAAPAGLSYQSIERLPDFSGWWDWQPAPDDFGPEGPPQPFLHAPVKPEIQAAIKDLISKVFDTSTAARPDDAQLGINPRDVCAPPRFLGVNGGYGLSFEVLFTPGRVTVVDEAGLIRRIDLSGRPLPADVSESNAGTSVGRWEGSTLVVETAGLNSEARLVGPFKLGKGSRIVERFSLKEPDGLEIALQMTAPGLLTAPFERTFVYHRDRGHEFFDLNNCTENDRSIDPASGKQRFDLTPPEGLPPPPTE